MKKNTPIYVLSLIEKRKKLINELEKVENELKDYQSDELTISDLKRYRKKDILASKSLIENISPGIEEGSLKEKFRVVLMVSGKKMTTSEIADKISEYWGGDRVALKRKLARRTSELQKAGKIKKLPNDNKTERKVYWALKGDSYEEFEKK